MLSNVSDRFDAIEELISTAKYEENDKAFAVTAKWYNAFREAAEQKNNSFQRKIINNITDNENRLDPLLAYKYDYFIVPEKAWNLIKSWYHYNKEVQIPVFYNENSKLYEPCVLPKEISVNFQDNLQKLFLPEDSTIQDLMNNIKWRNTTQNYKIYDYWMNNKGNEIDPSIKLKDLTNNQCINFIYTNDQQQLQPTGIVPGCCGLENVGQTCYINSIIQCLAHCSTIKDYFLSDQIRNDLNDSDNIDLTNHFIHILDKIWNGNEPFARTGEFKKTLANLNQMFNNTFQQDASEFLICLLAILSESFTKKEKSHSEKTLKKDSSQPIISENSDKPNFEDFTTEKSTNSSDSENTSNETTPKESIDKLKHISNEIDENKLADEAVNTQIDDNFIGNNFFGLFKVVSSCPNCKHTTTNFTSFSELTLRIPSEKNMIYVIFFKPDMKERNDFYIQKSPNIQSLYECIAFETNTKNFAIVSQDGKFCKLNSEMSYIFAYEIPEDTSLNYVVVKVEGLVPIVIGIDNLSDETSIKEVVSTKVQQIANKQPSSIILPTNFTKSPLFKNCIEESISATLDMLFQPQNLMSDHALTLDLCLKATTMTTILDDNNLWTCQNCQKSVRAYRKTYIHKAPPILAVHLLRFEYDGQKYNKDSRPVLYGNTLKLSDYVTQHNGDDKYELFSVVMHGGSMQSGHYTAMCKFDDKVCLFNDQMVVDCKEVDMRAENAYIMFYKLIQPNQ